MQCPNCKRIVRSTTQCAHCGTVFDGIDSQNTQEVNKEDVTQAESRVTDQESLRTEREKEKIKYATKSTSSGRVKRFFSGLWSVIKLIILVVAVFLIFLFAPRFVTKLMNKNETEKTEVVESQPIESQSEIETESTPAQVEEAESGLQLVGSNVELKDYPAIQVTLDFNELPSDVGTETFAFNVETDGQTDSLDKEYSLVKDGNKLTLTYNDPSAVIAASQKQQTLVVKSNDLSIDEKVNYDIPATTVDQDKLAKFNEIITDNFGTGTKVSAAFSDVKNKTPLVYDNQTNEASTLISWFVLARTYQAVEDGQINFEDTVEIMPELIPANEESSLAAEEGEGFTVQDLISSVISQQDVGALNHLIQLTGGPNEFNLWLNESNYFATKITSQLDVSESASIKGAVTNPQDLALLMTKLANNELISPEKDEKFREDLLMTPMSDKYPSEGLDLVERRFEITSSDTDSDSQYYSAIIQTEETNYVVVFMLNQPSDVEGAVGSISGALADLVNFFETGELSESHDSQEETPEESVEEPAQEVVPVAEPAQEPYVAPEANYQEPSSAMQYVENVGQEVELPVIYNADGSLVQWYWDEAAGRYFYR